MTGMVISPALPKRPESVAAIRPGGAWGEG
jgi:hypothetical protein